MVMTIFYLPLSALFAPLSLILRLQLLPKYFKNDASFTKRNVVMSDVVEQSGMCRNVLCGMQRLFL